MKQAINLTFIVGLAMLSFPGHGAPTTAPAPAENTSTTSVTTPPKATGVEWVRVPFEKAETELLSLVKRDLPELERATTQTAVYDIQVTGPLPDDYSKLFRAKLEKVLLMSKVMTVKDCSRCDEAQVTRDAEGKLQFESRAIDPARTARIASDLGVSALIFADVDFTSEDLRLRLKVIDAKSNAILWSRDYSTEEYLRDRDGRFRLDPEGPGELVREGDSLSQVMLGEIAFTLALSPGAILLPTVDRGRGTERMFYPSVDLLIGERYNRGHNRFGFVFGGAFNASSGPRRTDGIPFLARVGPSFRHTFNPYNTSFARYSMVSEAGVAIGSGLTTPFIGMGAEIGMVRRFSVTVMPMYILSADVAPDVAADVDGRVVMARGPTDGRFGGFALLFKGNITW